MLLMSILVIVAGCYVIKMAGNPSLDNPAEMSQALICGGCGLGIMFLGFCGALVGGLSLLLGLG